MNDIPFNLICTLCFVLIIKCLDPGIKENFVVFAKTKF